MSTASSVRGPGRPALTLKTDMEGVKLGNAIPRVYQSESRNAFITEYERFKEVKLNMGAMFPASPLSDITLEGWVDFRIGIVEDRLAELRDALASHEERARDKKKAFARENGPIPLYDVQIRKYPQPALGFPALVVGAGGSGPLVTRRRRRRRNAFKMGDAYFQKWTEVAYIWDRENWVGGGGIPGPISGPKSRPYNGSYPGSDIFSSPARPSDTPTPVSSEGVVTPEPKDEEKAVKVRGEAVEIENYTDPREEQEEFTALQDLSSGITKIEPTWDLLAPTALLKQMALENNDIASRGFPAGGYAFESGSEYYSDRPDDYEIYLSSPHTSQNDEDEDDAESEEPEEGVQDGGKGYTDYGAFLNPYTAANGEGEVEIGKHASGFYPRLYLDVGI